MPLVQREGTCTCHTFVKLFRIIIGHDMTKLSNEGLVHRSALARKDDQDKLLLVVDFVHRLDHVCDRLYSLLP